MKAPDLSTRVDFTVNGFQPAGPWRVRSVANGYVRFETASGDVQSVLVSDLTELEPGHLRYRRRAGSL